MVSSTATPAPTTTPGQSRPRPKPARSANWKPSATESLWNHSPNPPNLHPASSPVVVTQFSCQCVEIAAMSRRFEPIPIPVTLDDTGRGVLLDNGAEQ